VTLTNLPQTHWRSETNIVDGSVNIKTGIRLSALKPDLETLRQMWLNDTNETRAGRIQFFENRETAIKIIVTFAPKLFKDEHWQEDFLMIELVGDGDFNTTSIFYKGGTFYARKELLFEPIPDDEFVPVLPVAAWIFEQSTYIEIRYATLDTIALALRQHESLGFNFIEKISNFFRIDLSLIFVEDLVILPRETQGNYYDEAERFYYRYNHILDGVYHKIVRFDRRTKVFYTKNNHALDGSYFARTADFRWQAKLAFKVSHAITDRWDPEPAELAPVVVTPLQKKDSLR